MLRLALERQGAMGATRKRFASPPARDRREEARKRKRRRIFLEPRRGLVDGGIGAREPRSARCEQSRRKSTVVGPILEEEEEEQKEGGGRKRGRKKKKSWFRGSTDLCEPSSFDEEEKLGGLGVVDRPRGLCWYAWNRKQDGGKGRRRRRRRKRKVVEEGAAWYKRGRTEEPRGREIHVIVLCTNVAV